MGAVLIGRERECEALHQLLQRQDAALVTVTGPGGMGKTRLALHVASQAAGAFEHGVAVVQLAAVRDVGLVASAIASALGVQGQGNQPEWERVKDCLQERRLLLVLDNFEHLLSAVPLVGELLRELPSLKVLATSRVRLHLSGEQEFGLGPLELPHGPAPLQALQAMASVQLFVQRAQALQRGFALAPDNAEAVAELCVRLDGWPLAIELAAARIKLLTPQQMLPRLQSRLALLTGGPVDQPQRHRTLRAALDWSHELLGVAERSLFARLSVFNGGARLEAVEAVCASSGPPVLETLQSLVDHSLVQQQDGRFTMLETVREYARERLQQAGREGDCRQVHAEHFLQLAEQAKAHQSGPRQREWFGRLAADLDNFREAMAWLLAQRQAEAALRMASGLSLFCMLRALGAEARSWIEAALPMVEDRRDALHAEALGRLGVLCSRLGDMRAARQHLEEALQRWRALGDPAGTAGVLVDLGWTVLWQGNNLDAAAKVQQEALAMAKAAGDRVTEGRAAVALGAVLQDKHETAAARELLEHGLSVSREAGDEWRVTVALLNLSILCANDGQLAQARAHAEEALVRGRLDGNVHVEVGCLSNLAEWHRREGDHERAAALLRTALSKGFAVGDWRSTTIVLENLAELCVGASHHAAAVRLIEAAAVRRERYAIGPPPGQPELLATLRATALAQLGEAAFEAARLEGRAMTMGELLALAESVLVPVPADPHDAAVPAGLTARELEVLKLVARGLSDKQVAGRLGIQPSTVSKHVANLLGKTACANRLALTLWAMEQRVVGVAGA